ncbi:MAG: YraN family protein [Phycisphaerales bacterium]
MLLGAINLLKERLTIRNKLRGKSDSVWTRGEDAATAHFRKLGYKILDRNLRLSMGEIDVLCLEPKSNTLVVVEVKARQKTKTDSRRIDPEANITAHKKIKLRTLARALQQQDKYAGLPIRIDVIAVVFEQGTRAPIELRHYESAV